MNDSRIPASIAGRFAWGCLWLLLVCPATVHAQLKFITNNSAITITGFSGTPGVVAIPDTTNGFPVTAIANQAFYQSSLKGLTMGKNVASIGYSVFYGCSQLTNIVIGTNVGIMGDYTFNLCTQLRNIVIPDSVTNVGWLQFMSCSSLTNVTIGKGVSIPYNSSGALAAQLFQACPNLLSITVSSLNPTYSSVGGVLFNKTQSLLIAYPGGLTGSYTIPSTVNTLGYTAFADTGLTNLVIPSSVLWVDAGGVIQSDLPGAFAGTNNLKSISVDPSNPYYSSSDGILFNKNQTVLIAFPGGRAPSYSVPGSVTTIDRFAFSYSTGLRQVYFPGDAPSGNGNSAFRGSTGTVFYVSGTAGWGATFGGWPTAAGTYQRQPAILGSDSGLGFQANKFQFTISWATNTSVVIQASTNLVNWTSLVTNSLINGTNAFSDTKWTNYSRRFYRVSLP